MSKNSFLCNQEGHLYIYEMESALLPTKVVISKRPNATVESVEALTHAGCLNTSPCVATTYMQ